MIPPSKNGLPAMALISTMQKAVRRNMPDLAMQCAVELMHTSKGFNTMVTNRLELIAHEDIDTAASPHIVPFVRASMEQAREWWNDENPGKSRMAVGNAIRMMCAAPKSRIGDHFQAAIGLANLFDLEKPEIPDWANDGHTLKGKAMGRGVEFFRDESTKLVPPQAGGKDAYEDRAYAMWEIKATRKPGKKPKGQAALDV